MKRRLTISLAVVFALLLVISLIFVFNQKHSPDAIVILPGIMGSELFLAENSEYDGEVYPADTKLWLGVDTVQQIFEIPDDIRMLIPENGYSIRTSAPIINNPAALQKYGTTNTYRTLYRSIYDHFGDNCDVIFFSYDWREDPYETARKLDSFLIEQGYKSVSVVAHSMGGLVASHYFAMGETQRKKIDTYLSLGTPYLGSEQASYAMVTGNVSGFFANVLISGEARNICPRIDSMYALLPYSQLWRSSLAVYGLKGLNHSKAFGEEELLLAEHVRQYSQGLHDKAKERKALLFTDNGKHISELVNSYYLAGDGEETITSLNLPDNPSFSAALTTTSKSSHGDGTVSLYSACAGGTLASERFFVKQNGKDRKSSHCSLADGSDKSTMEFIIEVLKGNADKISDFNLKSKYNIQKGIPDFD